MKCNISKGSNCAPMSLLITLLFFLILPFNINAQGMRMEKGEKASCIIKVNSVGKTASPAKVHNVESNEAGFFKQVSNIKPSENVLIEIMYPSAKPGEKVVVNVLDGGKLDNGKGVKVTMLNKQQKCVFGFRVSDDAGIYRLLLRKGNDVKVVRLWVGKETF